MLAQANDDLAKESQNPLSTVISLPFENNTLFGLGPSDSVSNIFSIKPVYPLTIGNWNLINRFIVPVVGSQGQDEVVLGDVDVGFGNPGGFGVGSDFGLGDMTYQAFFSPSKTGKIIWGVGPALVLPTHTSDRFGTDKWSAGPTAVALAMPGNWNIGVLVQNVWSFAGDSDAPTVNKFLFWYWFVYYLKDDWYLFSAPVITANWKSENANRWTVPIGGGIGKLVQFGKQPVDFNLGAYYNAERPAFNPVWNLQITANFLFPK